MKLFPILLTVAITISANSALAGYDDFSSRPFDNTGTRMGMSNNIVTKAIETDRFIPLRYNQQFSGNIGLLYKEIADLGQYELEMIDNPALVRALQGITGEFACAYFRYANKLPSADRCGSIGFNDKQVEDLPFYSGQYTMRRMEAITRTHKKQNIEFEAYLPSTNERSLDSIWGAVHKAGLFFNTRTLDSRDLVLSSGILFYKLDQDGNRTGLLYPEPLATFIFIPSEREIRERASEKDAAKFAIDNARIVVPYFYSN